MNSSRQTTKIFAFLFLLFAGISPVAAQNSIYELEAGTRIRVQMDNEINSGVSSAGDTFTTTIAEPVRVRETVVLPVGTVIEGRVTKVERASAGGKGGSISVLFETIRFETGEKRAIEGVLTSELKAESSPKTGVLAILGGAGLGAVIGGASKGGSGALLGAGVGAGIGTTVALTRKGKNVRIRNDEKFEIQLTKKVNLPVRDY